MDGSSRAPAEEATERSLWRRATATRWGRVALAGGMALLVSLVVVVVLVMSVPRPDAVLTPIALEPDAEISEVIGTVPWFEIDSLSLYAYEPYQGWELWSAVNEFGSPCLFVLPPGRDVIGWSCTPAPGEPLVDTTPLAVREAGMIRFVMSRETVLAYVYPEPSDG